MYKICNRCLMDTSAIDIVFDNRGYCNFCSDFLKVSNLIKANNTFKNLDKFINKVKNQGKNLEYDCVVGISGGVDSSWALKKTVEYGLRPLVVHFDNGWNTNMSQENIYKLLKKLKLNLITYVVDWMEYKEIMQSFFKSNVVDIELIYDNALMKINYSIAKKFNVKYIFAGTNRATEGMRMPKNWNWFKYDKKNIHSIQKKFGNKPIKSLPTIGTLDFIYYSKIHNIKWINFLDYFDYNKSLAMDELCSFSDFTKYKIKHSESIFTRFYQCHILPKKFKIDKRRIHLSNLVITNQMSRDKALEVIKTDPYSSFNDYLQDKKFFLKKMDFSEEYFNRYLSENPISHQEYHTEKIIWEKLEIVYKKIFKKIL